LQGQKGIRLLELSPRAVGAPISGRIKRVDLDSRPQYIAVSYVWGVSFKPHRLTTPEGDIPLTFSLYSALQSLQKRDNPVVLWADAICIDQSNNHEKVTQVRLMRQIYQSAEHVIGWIGDEKENSYGAIKTLLQISMQAAHPISWPSSLASIPDSWSGRKIPSLNDGIWKDINALFQREWFRRVWIIQEVVLGDKVKLLCGKWTVD